MSAMAKNATLMWLSCVGGVGVVLVFVVIGGREPVAPPEPPRVTADVAPPPSAVARPPAPEQVRREREEVIEQAVAKAKKQSNPGKIIYTFANDTTLREFITLWQHRQEILRRIRLLESYWAQEQARMADLVNTLMHDYQVDPMKDYILDRQRRVLREETPLPDQ